MTKTLTGTFQLPSGGPVAFGTLYLKLTQDATVVGTGQIVPATPLAFPLDINGTLGSGVTIFASDELNPAGISYVLTVSEQGGGQVYGPEFFVISGASPINLNNLTPTANSPVVFSTAILSNPTGPQTITGQPLSLSGQALTNAVLTGVSSGNSVVVLNAQANAALITGNSGVQTVYTFTIPGNSVANLKGIRVTIGWLHTGAANVTYSLNLNGQVSANPINGASGTGSQLVATFLNTGATTGSFSFNFVASNSGGSAGAGTLTGLSWSSNQILVFTFNVANTDSVTPLQWLVELIQ